MMLPFVGPIHGLAGSIALNGQHDTHARIVFALSSLGWGRGGKQSSTEGATQSFQFIDRGLKDGLGHDANNPSRHVYQIEFSLQTLRAKVASLEVRMGNFDPLGSWIIIGSMAAVALGLGPAAGSRAVPGRGRVLRK